MKPILVVPLALFAFACGKEKEPVPEDPRVVLVLDRGFDLSHPALADRVLASYSITCPEPPADDETADAAEAATPTKAETLAAIQAEDAGCEIQEGTAFKAHPAVTALESERDAWNAAVQGRALIKDEAYFKKQKVLSGFNLDPESETYHGTMVASVIARSNPNVQLVLVDLGFNGLSFVGIGKTLLRPLKVFHRKKACRPQAEFDEGYALLADAELASAEATHVPAWKTRLFEIARMHGATLLNYSYAFPQELKVHHEVPQSAIDYQAALTGTVPEVNNPWRSTNVPLAEWPGKSGCGYWDFAKVFKAGNDMTAAHWQQLIATGAFDPSQLLVFQGAGNARGTYDERDDALDFADPAAGRLLIGAHDASRTPAFYSSQGKAVSLYALGNDVVVAAPKEFDTVNWGTSLASPMAVRYVTTSMSSSLTAAEVATELAARLDANRALPADAMPEELTYSVGTASLFF